MGAPLAVVIAIHNIPEGIAIALPVYMATGRRDLALGASFIFALAEPLGAALGYFILAPFMSFTVYGMVFGVIGGVMVFLALDQLLRRQNDMPKLLKQYMHWHGILSTQFGTF